MTTKENTTLKSFGWYGSILHISLLGLAAMVVLISLENRRLETVVADLTTQPADFEIGSALPAVAANDLEGRDYELSFASGSESSVLLIFSTECGSCTQNLENWRDLYRDHKDQYRFIGVSLEDAEPTRDYAKTHNVPFPIILPRDRDAFMQAYGVQGVPLTLVADGSGVAVDARLGVLPKSYGLDS